MAFGLIDTELLSTTNVVLKCIDSQQPCNSHHQVTLLHFSLISAPERSFVLLRMFLSHFSPTLGVKAI